MDTFKAPDRIQWTSVMTTMTKMEIIKNQSEMLQNGEPRLSSSEQQTNPLDHKDPT